MVKNKNQTLLQKFQNWWHNLPHKWFLLFQILNPFLIIVLIVGAQSGFHNFFLCLILTLLIIQCYLIKRYYGTRCLIHCIILLYLFPMIPVAFFLLLKYIVGLEIDTDTALDNIGIFAVSAPFIAIIPQYWRSNNHGRK